MKKIVINDFVCKILHTEKEIQKNVQFLADKIYHDYKDKENIVLLIIMNGGMDFGIDLSRALEKRGLKHARENITATRYNSKGEAVGDVEIIHKPNLSLSGKNVIVIEDLVDKGDTLNSTHDYLIKLNPESLTYAVIGVKKGHTFAGPIGYKLINELFPDLWLFGYGMDWGDEHRSYKQIMYKTQKIHNAKN
jgi:hypoxanthine phosphoribosyltransferase